MISPDIRRNREAAIAAATGLAMAISATLLFAGAPPGLVRAPLVVAVVAGGVPLLGAVVTPERWLLWLGVLFVLAVYHFPSGIVGRLRTAGRAIPSTQRR